MELPAVNLKVILLVHWLLAICFWGDFSAKPRLETIELTCAFCSCGSAVHTLTGGLHRVPGRLRVVQLHHPGFGRVGRRAAGLHRRHKYVSGWLGGHHLPGHRPHQHLLPKGQPLGHRALQRRHGHRQHAPQAGLLLLHLPNAPGARGFPWTFTGSQCLPDD
uniref:Angiotensin II receptor associated protein n=1 Tax=Phocoena sinus TaxID=42100 RepID=A0A8C9BXI1_PHOSS